MNQGPASSFSAGTGRRQHFNMRTHYMWCRVNANATRDGCILLLAIYTSSETHIKIKRRTKTLRWPPHHYCTDNYWRKNQPARCRPERKSIPSAVDDEQFVCAAMPHYMFIWNLQRKGALQPNSRECPKSEKSASLTNNTLTHIFTYVSEYVATELHMLYVQRNTRFRAWCVASAQESRMRWTNVVADGRLNDDRDINGPQELCNFA